MQTTSSSQNGCLELSSAWLHTPRKIFRPAAYILCFPHAGGNAAYFRRWVDAVRSDAELRALSLPGRLGRSNEAFVRDLKRLAEMVGQAIASTLDRPFVFFGHSMGAILSFEVTRWLRRNAFPLPQTLFVSGHTAPQINNVRTQYSALSEEEFIEQLRGHGGLPDVVLANRELMKLVLPAIRADCCAIETWEYDEEEPLDCPIVAMGGKEDATVSKGELEAWGDVTYRRCVVHQFPGGHFYLNDVYEEVLAIINGQLFP